MASGRLSPNIEELKGLREVFQMALASLSLGYYVWFDITVLVR